MVRPGGATREGAVAELPLPVDLLRIMGQELDQTANDQTFWRSDASSSDFRRALHKWWHRRGRAELDATLQLSRHDPKMAAKLQSPAERAQLAQLFVKSFLQNQEQARLRLENEQAAGR